MKRPFKVVLDAGHGGKDVGSTSVSGAHEKDIVLDITIKILGNFHLNEDIEVELIREDDSSISPTERVNKIDGADLFISIHADSPAPAIIYDAYSTFERKSKHIANIAKQELDKIDGTFKVGYTGGLLYAEKCKLSCDFW